ncbi:restriction endonuclease [Psychrobacillus sp. AK 1817]|uniref:restriction endonuclease FokI C-terminal domain-containing protein n=1 Tax=Psychrobacillus sp. AK 1817 TaxID=2303505 RepID=UPI0012469512|nr:restriction endonuclease FokI C-terminal domain-containing protein [Psychrobacillus sp. AK 1817]QEY21616.1 restriction endonuclease [Psychrobacillus sp. AK 1817]
MINNWQVPRNKRKLYPVVDVLSLFTLQTLGDNWRSNLNRQLDFEAELERYGLKRTGQRRDRRAGGARTYESWLYNLGLIFKETNTDIVRTTLAGEALLAGQPPVPIITNQLMKLQYPSPYSVRGRVNIHYRFQVRPFRFLLRLLADSRVQSLSKEEIGRFVITEGENESRNCFEHVVQRIISYRLNGDAILPSDFEEQYLSSTTGLRSREKTLSYLEDIANTFINYLEYTQLIERNSNGIYIPQDRISDVDSILNDGTNIRQLDTNHPYGIENFQRGFGLAPGQNRDNRNFGGQTVTDNLYRERRIRSDLLHIAGTRPITNFTVSLVREIADSTGYSIREVEDALDGFRPDTFSQFEASYLNMAISGTELATEFEIATRGIFEQLGFHAEHVGNHALHPDIFVESPQNYSGIIDTKAYRTYTINNDHRNRMVNNYIPTYQNQYGNVEFFMYVADGFGSNIASQVQNIADRTNVNGSVITARNVIRLLQRYQATPIDHNSLRILFANNSVITMSEIDSL